MPFLRFRLDAVAGAFLVAGLLPSLGLAQEVILIAPSFDPGDVHYIEQVEHIEEAWGEGPFGPARTERSTRLRGVLRRVEVPSDDGATRIHLVFDRVRFTGESPRGPIEFDSDASDPSQRNNSLGNIGYLMPGMAMTLYVDPTGRISAFTGMEAIFERVEDAAAGNLVFEPMQSDFTDETAKFTWGDSRYVLYPYQKVNVGAGWRRRIKTHDLYLGDLTYTYHCRLEDVGISQGRRVANLSYEATIVVPKGARSGCRLFNCDLRVESGQVKGTAVFDLARGELVQQTEEVTLAIKGSFPGPPDGEDIEFTVDRTTKRTVTVMTLDQRNAQKAKRRQGAR